MKVSPAIILALMSAAHSAALGQNPRYEPRAEALLREVERATLAVKSLGAEVNVIRILDKKRERVAGTARLMRPNLARVDLRGKLGQTIAANGARLWIYNTATNQFVTRKTLPSGKDIANSFGPLIPLAMFFDPKLITVTAPPGTHVKLEGPVMRDGSPQDIIALIAPDIQIRLFVGPDRLVRRSVTSADRKGQKASFEVELARLKIGTPYPRSSFRYSPPRNAAEIPGSIKVEVGSSSGKQNRR